MGKKPKAPAGHEKRSRSEGGKQDRPDVPDDTQKRTKVSGAASSDTRHDEIKTDGYRGRDLPGAAGFTTAGAEEDTYD